MEHGFVNARRCIQERIYDYLMQRKQSKQIAPEKLMDIARHLEEGLFKTATTKEEYMNLETMENRIHTLIKRLPLKNQNEPYQQQGNYSVPMMIPTPGMPQSGNSIMVPSAMDNNMVSAGNFLHNVPSDGENNMISSMSAQRIASQMIPTPGFNNTNNTSNQSYMNIDSSNTTIDSTTVCHPLQQKQQVAGLNSRMLHSLASHMAAGGIRSCLHQDSRWQEAPNVLSDMLEQHDQEEFNQRMSGLNLN